MLIICDFDGTVTVRDTNSALARRFAPEAYAGLEGKLASRELTLREVLTAEFAPITVGLDAVIDAALEVPFRPGFHEFVDAVDATPDAQLILLSSGFRELIEPMLARDGLAGRIPLHANSIRLDDSGGHITWRDLPTCPLCGEPCKRHDVAALARQHAAERVVFIGDGLSDRCGAESATTVFARDSLARHLDELDHPWQPWNDFHDIAAALDLAVGARP